MNRYLLVVWNDVEPHLEGPFPNDEARLERAQAIRQGSDEHGIYRLDAAGEATVAPFSGGEIED